MTLPAAYRKYTESGDGTSGQVFSVPFGIDTDADLFVYEGDDLQTLTTNYSVTGEGIPESIAEPEGFDVTWNGSTVNGTTYTFLRMSKKTQLEIFPTSSDGNKMERVVRRMSYQCQESIFATLEILDTNGSRIQSLAAPIANEDIATHLYTQARFSTTGYLPPPVSGTDEDKILYSEDQQRLVWKDPFDVPTDPVNGELLRVQKDGSVEWEPELTLPPALPTLPSFLSTDASGSAIEWRTIDDLPATLGIDETMSIVAQQGGSAAWENVKNLPPLPSILDAANKNYILTLWSAGNITSSDLEITPSKMSFIKQGTPTTNFGSNYALRMNDSPVNRQGILMEVDLTSYSLDADEITYASIEMYKFNGKAGSGTATASFARLKQSWTEDGVTYRTYDGTNDWLGGEGAFNDIDTDMHIYPFVINGRDIDPADIYYEYEITELVRDAVKNRQSILNVYMFFKNTGLPNMHGFYRSEDSASNKPNLKITTTATARQEKWLAVAWGNTTVDPTDVDLDEAWFAEGAYWDHEQSHFQSYAKATITHSLGFANLLGTASVISTRGSSGAGTSSESFEVTIDTKADDFSALVYVFATGAHLYSENISSVPDPTAQVDISYTIWSPDTKESSSLGEGEACSFYA